jgi:hypothetical protein
MEHDNPGNMKTVSIALSVTLLVLTIAMTGLAIRAHFQFGDIPRGWATFFGSFVGLGSVALGSWLGFNTLRRGQEHQAELNRLAREHQRQEELRTKAARDLVEARQLAAALWGEVETMTWACESYERYSPLLKEMIATSSAAKLSIEIYPELITTIFDAHVSRVTLLPRALIGPLTAVYARAAHMKGAREVKGKPELVAELVETAACSVALHLGQLKQLGEQLKLFADEGETA